MPGEPGECGWLVVGCFLGVDIFFFDVQDISKRERSLGGWLVLVSSQYFLAFFSPWNFVGEDFSPILML